MVESYRRRRITKCSIICNFIYPLFLTITLLDKTPLLCWSTTRRLLLLRLVLLLGSESTPCAAYTRLTVRPVKGDRRNEMICRRRQSIQGDEDDEVNVRGDIASHKQPHSSPAPALNWIHNGLEATRRPASECTSGWMHVVTVGQWDFYFVVCLHRNVMWMMKMKKTRKHDWLHYMTTAVVAVESADRIEMQLDSNRRLLRFSF